MEVVETTADLKAKIDKIIKTAEFVAIDTEFVREKSYYAHLGLIQIGYEGDDFVVDPVSENLDISPLEKLFDNENIVKIFHACGQDLEIFYNYFGKLPKNVFDTQVAARLLGFGEAISYGNLVHDYMDIRLDKSARYTDWMNRPLNQEQIRYALDDVIYLKQIYPQIINDLNDKNRLNWALEECEKLLDEKIYFVDPDECWQKLKIKSQDKKYLSLLKALARWREIQAQNLNKPRNWVLKDDAIQEIASLKPKEEKDLKNSRFYRFDDRNAAEILGVVDYAINEETPPKIKRKKYSSDSITPLVALLRIVLKNQSLIHDIAPSVIADSDDLKMIASGDLEDCKSMQGWRFEVFGKFAQKLLNSQLAITADGKDVIMIEPVIE